MDDIPGTFTVGDRYRMLISLGRRDLGEQIIRDALAPGRDAATTILIDGQHDGVFADHLPPKVLNTALEGLMLALLDAAATSGAPTVAASTAATAVLIAAGLTPEAARSTADAVEQELRANDPA